MNWTAYLVEIIGMAVLLIGAFVAMQYTPKIGRSQPANHGPLCWGLPVAMVGMLLILTACATPDPGIKVEYREVLKEVPRPCPVTKPTKPGKLARPLPTDPARLVDLLLGKLIEWAGPGGYGERANSAIETCIKP